VFGCRWLKQEPGDCDIISDVALVASGFAPTNRADATIWDDSCHTKAQHYRDRLPARDDTGLRQQRWVPHKLMKTSKAPQIAFWRGLSLAVASFGMTCWKYRT
jgi:hypothetical protein